MQIGLAVANYESAYGMYPPAFIASEDGTPMHSWRVLILPFLDRPELHAKYDFSKPWNSETNSRLAKEMPDTYAFTGDYDSDLVYTNYVAVLGEDTFWPGKKSRTTEELTDELSSTIVIMENINGKMHWMEPRDLKMDTMSFKLNQPNGLGSKYENPAVLMADFFTREIDTKMPKKVFRALLTVNGQEPVDTSGDYWKLLLDGRLRSERDSELGTQN